MRLRPLLFVCTLTLIFSACRVERRHAEEPKQEEQAAAPAPPPPPQYSGETVDIPAGSRLILTIGQDIDSKRMSAGTRFRSTLNAALLDAQGKQVVPEGTTVMGVIVEAKSAGRVRGRSELEIAFTDIELNGFLFPIHSQGVEAAGEDSRRDTARKVGAGALIGGVAGGGKGAATGAAIGGGAAILTRGQEIKIPAGTMLELSLLETAKVAAPSAESATAPAATDAATDAAAPPVADTTKKEPVTDKECVKKLMENGFTADEAVASCTK